jgi:hypothetical protein
MTANIDPPSTLVSPWGKDPKSIYSIFRKVDEARMAKLVFECLSGSGLITWDLIHITFPSFQIQPEAPLYRSASFPPATSYLKLSHSTLSSPLLEPHIPHFPRHIVSSKNLRHPTTSLGNELSHFSSLKDVILLSYPFTKLFKTWYWLHFHFYPTNRVYS